MTAPKLLPPADPYDHTDERNHLAVHTPQPLDMARKTPIGKIALAPGSDFLGLAQAAGVNPAALVLELSAVASKNPAVLSCTPASIVTFLLDAAKLDLSVGRGIYAVPVKGKLEGWVGYKGAKELACRGGAIRDAWASVHFEGDDFEFDAVPVPTVRRHKPGPHHGDMKHALGVYCTLLYPGHVTRMKYFSRKKIESYRALNASSKGNTSPWVTREDEMWQAKAILHTVGDLPHSSKHMAHLREMLDRDEPPALAAGAPVSPPAEQIPEGEFEPAEEPVIMSLGVASAIVITTKGGHVRTLGEMRNSGLDALLTWARAGLEQDPEAERLQRIAVGCTTVLEARAAGLAKEPPKQEGN